MIQLTSKMSMDSRLLPGARVHLKKFNVERRARIFLKLADQRAKLAELGRQLEETVIVPPETDEQGSITKPGDSQDVIERKNIRAAALMIEIEACEAYQKPAVLREYVELIEGVEIDGAPMTAETLVSAAPPEFGDEIYRFIQENNGLPPFDGGNSQSPLPSTDGTNPGSTATTA